MTRAGHRARAVLVAVVTLSCVLFPALAAGAGLDRPATDAEVAALVAASRSDASLRGPSELFLTLLLPEDAAGWSEPLLRERLPMCRLAAVAFVLALSGLTYLAVTLARGRARAVLACLALGCLWPVYGDGALLRAEVPSAVFGALGTVLLCLLPARLGAARRANTWRAVPAVAALAVAAGVSFALAASSHGAYGVFLLVPAACLLLALGRHGIALLRVLRRFRFAVLPFRAFTLRVLPWLMVAFAALAAAAALLAWVAAPAQPTGSGAGLLPRSMSGAIPLAALAVVGGVLSLLRVGLELGRAGRLSAGAVLFVHCGVLLLHRARADAVDDALPAAMALAVLVAEGGFAVLVVAGGLMVRRGGANAASPDAGR